MNIYPKLSFKVLVQKIENKFSKRKQKLTESVLIRFLRFHLDPLIQAAFYISVRSY